MKTENIKLIVKPNSSVSGVYGIYKGRIKIKLNSIAEKGKANKELMRFISVRTGIPRKNIKIVAGEKSGYKELSLRHDKDFDLTSKILKG
ncbi:MAG: DUF167 domain-containing protein [Actinomycetota bacterium]|nr:DUF167 domain-containing protein [Actinomycetota bacterium]